MSRLLLRRTKTVDEEYENAEELSVFTANGANELNILGYYSDTLGVNCA